MRRSRQFCKTVAGVVCFDTFSREEFALRTGAAEMPSDT